MSDVSDLTIADDHPMLYMHDIRKYYDSWLEINAPSDSEINYLFEKYHIPTRFREHCYAVSDLSTIISNLLNKNGIIINTNLVRSLSLIHDGFKFFNIEDITISPQGEEHPTEKEKDSWIERKEQYNLEKTSQYKYLHETYIAADIIRREFPNTFEKFAKVLEMIGSTNDPVYLKAGPEVWIHHYADKRIDGTKLISMEERLAIMKQRYFAGEEKEWKDRMQKEKHIQNEIHRYLPKDYLN